MTPLQMIDDRTPEQLRADGCERWPDGSRYTPPHLQGEERVLFLRRQEELDFAEDVP